MPSSRRYYKKRPSHKKNNNNNKGAILDAKGDVYYKVESVAGYRRRKGGVHEYKIKWVGYDDLTWEPEDNLCASALEEAQAFRMKLEEEKLLGSSAVVAAAAAAAAAEAAAAKVVVTAAAAAADGNDGDNNVGKCGQEKEDKAKQPKQETDQDDLMALLEDDLVDCKAEHDETMEKVTPAPAPTGTRNTDYDPIDWTDAGQIPYRDVERIHVHQDPLTVKQRVVDARLSGVPVCLVGHKGWAQFAKNWLDPEKLRDDGDGDDDAVDNGNLGVGTSNDVDSDGKQSTTTTIATATSTAAVDAQQLHNTCTTAKANESDHDVVGEEEFLDLSKPHSLNITKMEEHIGKEPVPIRRKRDGFSNDPNKKKISLRAFLHKCWLHNNSSNNNGGGAATATGGAGLYLHQWQFPMSDTALSKLCGPGKNIPLPYNILGDDLLCYWHEPEQYLGDNPYQYIFMGREGTMSKLHRDKGGLMITIAPIIGQKEVVMVHRADGPTCMYHLDADLEKPDLNRYPLMCTARVWKTTLQPGEILIMPQGTYHQCRNVTPCLSYSRFVLDEINLRPFVESYFDEDATEIDHGQVLWNAAYELHMQLDEYSECARKEWQQTGTFVPPQDLPNKIAQALSSLRALRNICREIGLREIQKDYTASDWNAMVHDIDKSLHNFRYRYHRNPPKFSKKILHSRAETSTALANGRKRKFCHNECSSDGEDVSDDEDVEESSSSGNLKWYFRRAPKLSWEEKTSVISDAVKLGVGDHVVVKTHGVKLEGEIVDCRDDLAAAYVHFDDFDEYYDEFIPLDCLRVNVAGESSVGVLLGDVREGKVVYLTEKGEPYRAKVKSLRRGTFYRVSLQLSKGKFIIERWFSRESFVGKVLDEGRSDHAVLEEKISTTAIVASSSKAKVASLFDGVAIDLSPANLKTEPSPVVSNLSLFVEELETFGSEELGSSQPQGRTQAPFEA